MKHVIGFAFGITLSLSSPVLSCGFHNYAPQPTMVEHMMAGSAVVLARQSKSSPFSFEISEVLFGEAPAAEIPFLVDSSTRRILRQDDWSVLFSYSQETETWQRLVMISPSVRPVIDKVLQQLPDWRMGGDYERAETFAWLLKHPDPVVRRLALRELDRIDYSILRSLLVPIPAETLVSGIQDPSQQALKPIRVLLLGLSRDLSVAPLLRTGVAGNKAGFGPGMGAYATAWIELEGAVAVQHLAREFLTRQDCSRSARELIIEAMSLHSSYGGAEVADTIRSELREAIRDDPSLAVPAARQFMSRYDWSLKSAIGNVQHRIPFSSEEDEMLIGQYLFASGGQASNPLGLLD